MTTPHRTRILGDLDENAPEQWDWGGPAAPGRRVAAPVRARRGEPRTLEDEQTRRSGRRALASCGGSAPPTSTASSRSASATGSRSRSSRGSAKTGPPEQTVRAGEFLLGYANEYGPRPTADRGPAADLGATAATSSSASCARTSAGSGASSTRRRAGPTGAATRRRGSGSPRRWSGAGRAARRSRSRRTPTIRASPTRTTSATTRTTRAAPAARSARTSAARTRATRSTRDRAATGRSRSTGATGSCGAAASTGRRCRSSRRSTADDSAERGLHFICLNANIARQFEFVNHTWLNNPKFGRLYDDADPFFAPRAASRSPPRASASA